MQKILKTCIASAKFLKIWLANAKNIKNLHCQCKLGEKTRQIDEKKTCNANANILKIWLANAKNIKDLHCQCKLGKQTFQIDAKNKKTCIANAQI